MAATRRPRAERVAAENKGKQPSPGARHAATHEDVTTTVSQGLPGGSSLFQEVMAELHPPSAPSPQPHSPSSFRRRRVTQVKHVHYETDVKVERVDLPAARQRKEKNAREEGLRPHQKGKGDLEEEEEKEEEVEEGEEDGTEKQILHGRWHCYFVEKGTVTGLADTHCQHEHRIRNPSPSPATSPRPGRRFHHPSSSSSPSPSSPSPSFPSSPTPPEGSPRSRGKPRHPYPHPHNSSHSPSPPSSSSSLHPPLPDEFRGRSHSDTAVMARLSSSRKKGVQELAPGDARAATAGKTAIHSHSLQASPTASPRGGFPERLTPPGPGPARSSLAAARRGGAEVDDLAEGVVSVLGGFGSPPPILVEDTTGSCGAYAFSSSSSSFSSSAPASVLGAEKARASKFSSPTIPTDQLHYLYDQFLQPGSGGVTSGQRPSSAARAGH